MEEKGVEDFNLHNLFFYKDQSKIGCFSFMGPILPYNLFHFFPYSFDSQKNIVYSFVLKKYKATDILINIFIISRMQGLLYHCDILYHYCSKDYCNTVVLARMLTTFFVLIYKFIVFI